MKKIIAILTITMAITSAAGAESTYKKAAKAFSWLSEKAGEAAVAIAKDTNESINDFKEDITAPEEEQSGFAKLFNKICDSEPTNLGWHGDTGEEVPEGIFKGGIY